MNVGIDEIKYWLKHTTPGRAIVAGKEKAEVEERRAHADSVAKIEQDYRDKQPALIAEESAARAEYDKLNTDLLAAANRIRAATGARMAVKSTTEALIQRHRHALRQTASPLIREFRSELQTMYDRDRQITVMRRDDQIDMNGWTSKELQTTWPNIQAHLKALLAARDEALTWELLAVPEAEIETMIAEMRKRLELSRRKTQEYATLTAA